VLLLGGIHAAWNHTRTYCCCFSVRPSICTTRYHCRLCTPNIAFSRVPASRTIPLEGTKGGNDVACVGAIQLVCRVQHQDSRIYLYSHPSAYSAPSSSSHGAPRPRRGPSPCTGRWQSDACDINCCISIVSAAGACRTTVLLMFNRNGEKQSILCTKDNM